MKKSPAQFERIKALNYDVNDVLPRSIELSFLFQTTDLPPSKFSQSKVISYFLKRSLLILVYREKYNRSIYFWGKTIFHFWSKSSLVCFQIYSGWNKSYTTFLWPYHGKFAGHLNVKILEYIGKSRYWSKRKLYLRTAQFFVIICYFKNIYHPLMIPVLWSMRTLPIVQIIDDHIY